MLSPAGTSKKVQNGSRPVVGLMGGICCGKTTTAGIFEKYGFRRIDADAIVHELLDTSEVRDELKEAFGESIFEAGGSVNRKALADVAFDDSAKLERLNSILHPRVIDVIEQRLAVTEVPAVLDAALLVETGLDERFCSFLVFVEKPLEERIEIAVERRGWSPDELIRRESMQSPLELKKAKADRVIVNTGTIRDLDKSVKKVVKDIAGL